MPSPSTSSTAAAETTPPTTPDTRRVTPVSGCLEYLAEEGLEDCRAQDEAFCPGEDNAWLMPEITDTATPEADPTYGRRYCTGGPGTAAPGDNGASLTLADVEELIPLTPEIHTDNGGRGVRNAETNFYTPHREQTTTTTINGQQVEVRATIVEYRWDYGDGTPPRVTSHAGHPQAEFNTRTPTSHIYEDTGQYEVALTVVYTGQYRTEGGQWQAIPGTLTRTAAPVTADIWRTVTRNVDQDCTADPTAWGCTGPIEAPADR